MSVFVINQQGGALPMITEEVVGCLTAATNSSGNNKLIVCYPEKRFCEWSEDDKSVTLRHCSGSYGGAAKC